MGTFVESMEETSEGHVRLCFDESDLTVDLVVLANSTRPDNHIWQALDRNDDGTLKVNAYMQTSDPNIYAIGDTIKVRFQLTGKNSTCRWSRTRFGQRTSPVRTSLERRKKIQEPCE